MYLNLTGTSRSAFLIGLGTTGVRLRNQSGALQVKNNADSAFVDIECNTLRNNADSLIINADAAGAGADWTFTLNRPTAGMTANRQWTLPAAAPANGDVISIDATGQVAYTPSSSLGGSGAANAIKVDTTTVTTASGSIVNTGVTLAAGDRIYSVTVIVDTSFNNTSSLTVGIAGNTAKYMPASDSSLNGGSSIVYKTFPSLVAATGAEAIIINYVNASATVGSARVEIEYGTPG